MIDKPILPRYCIVMHFDPPEFGEISEIGLDDILTGLIPGSETPSADTSQTNESDNTNTTVDDPFGF